jgi:putative nucleotidyltransferase with HDIG domain
MKSREEAWELVTSRLSTVHLRSHLLASEACMRALAARLGEDEDLWALTGLVHDIDLDEVGGDMATHGIVGAGWLEEAGYPPELTSAVRIHAGHGEPSSRLERGLESLEVKSIKKRMKEKRFAANVDRDQIRGVETLGVPTDEFLGMCLDAMRSIRRDLGL